MSTTPSYLIRSKTMLRVMKTPVLPTPALCGRGQKGQQWGQRKQINIEKVILNNAPLCSFNMCVDIYHLQLKSYFAGDIVRCVIPVDHLPTVDRNRPILAELLFCFMYLANEIDEALSWFWHSLFRPVCELKLPYCPRLSILGTETECTELTL